jgi:hypothetical protein
MIDFPTMKIGGVMTIMIIFNLTSCPPIIASIISAIKHSTAPPAIIGSDGNMVSGKIGSSDRLQTRPHRGQGMKIKAAMLISLILPSGMHPIRREALEPYFFSSRNQYVRVNPFYLSVSL